MIWWQLYVVHLSAGILHRVDLWTLERWWAVCMWNLVYYSSFSVPACAGVQLWSCNVSWLLFFPYIITVRVAWDSTGSGLKGKTRCREYKTDHPELKHRPSEAFLFDSEPAKRRARLVPSDCSCRPKRLGAPVYYNTWLCSVRQQLRLQHGWRKLSFTG